MRRAHVSMAMTYRYTELHYPSSDGDWTSLSHSVLGPYGNVLLGAKCQLSDSEQEGYGLLLWRLWGWSTVGAIMVYSASWWCSRLGPGFRGLAESRKPLFWAAQKAVPTLDEAT
jgi:hypothetical protein